MVTDKTRRSTFIEQNLGLVHSCAGRSGGEALNTTTSTALDVWGW